MMQNQRSRQNQRSLQNHSSVFPLVLKVCLLASSTLFASSVLSAATEPLGYTLQDLLSAEEQQLTLKTRNREYPMGLLEESLKVQLKVVATSTAEEDQAATESSEDRD